MDACELSREVIGYNYPNTNNRDNLEFLLYELKLEQRKMQQDYEKKRKKERQILEKFYEPIS